jgi:hypothetical protein
MAQAPITLVLFWGCKVVEKVVENTWRWIPPHICAKAPKSAVLLQ